MTWDITAEVVSIIILCIIIIYSRKGNLLPTLKNQAFQLCLLVSSISICTNIVSTILLEHYQIVPYAINLFFLIVYYLSTPLMGVVYFIYTLANIYQPKEVKKYALISSLPACIYILVVVSNGFTNYLFRLNPVTGYQQGPLIGLTYVIFYIYVLFSLFIVIYKRKSLEKTTCNILGTFPFLSGVVILIQFMLPSYILTGTAATIALLIIYLYLQNKQLFTDSLTNILNRQEFNKTISILTDTNREFTVIVFSLKNFKFINDKFSQDIGDQILLEICNYIRSLYKKRLFYRYGGDEFAIIDYNKDDIKHIIESIETRMKMPWNIAGIDFILEYSIGGVSYPDIAHSSEEIINSLEYTVSLGKKDSTNVINFATIEMVTQIQRRYQILDILKDCIKNDSFEVYFQPIYDIETNTYPKAEALLRLPPNHLGFVSPAEFIPIAEENGLISTITYQVLNKACQFAKEIIDNRIDFVGVSVNFSIVQFMQEDLENKLLKIIDDHGIPYNMIKIEITETMFAINHDIILNFMNRMVKHDIQFLLDDFGTGYSNISSVVTTPFHTIKIDKSLVWHAMEDNKAAIVMRKMIEAFNDINVNVLAEGIEDEKQLEFMKQCGCAYLQGYYFSRPVPAEEALKIIKEHCKRV